MVILIRRESLIVISSIAELLVDRSIEFEWTKMDLLNPVLTGQTSPINDLSSLFNGAVGPWTMMNKYCANNTTLGLKQPKFG